MISKLKVACVSDIHLGHHRTKTHFILENLKKAFPDNEETGSIDLLFIAGDVFDRLLTFGSEEVRDITYWILELFKICIKRDIVVRVLEGTPSHDWKQSRIFQTVNFILGGKVQLKYIDALSIEYIERFDTTVLYVPDEVNHDANITWKQVSDLLSSHGLDQVDFACMHGSFHYQMPGPKSHTASRYLSIVRHYIFIGHVHQQSRHDRILAQGSFDRDTHGQEEPKGHYRVTLEKGQEDLIEFIENKGAKIFKTLDVKGLSMASGLDLLKTCLKYPDGSYFRLLLSRDDELARSLPTIKEMYPQYYWTTHLDDLETQETSLSHDQEEVPIPIAVTRDNVVTLIQNRMPPGLPPAVEQEALRLLERIAKEN